MKEDYRVNKPKTGYDFNIFGTFDLSVDQLEAKDQELFRSLRVFKAVDIPVESIKSLWGRYNISKYNVTDILEILHRRSLLNFVDEDR